MKLLINATAEFSFSVIIENVTTKNLPKTLAFFFNTVGIHLAEELAPSRARTLAESGTLHMFDHGKEIDYKFHLMSY